jgi:hypothetical protein
MAARIVGWLDSKQEKIFHGTEANSKVKTCLLAGRVKNQKPKVDLSLTVFESGFQQIQSSQ